MEAQDDWSKVLATLTETCTSSPELLGKLLSDNVINDDNFPVVLPALLQALKSKGPDFPEVDSEGNSILHSAVKHGGTRSLLKALLESGEDPTAENNHKDTLIHTATRVGNLETLQFLTAVGLDLNKRNKDDDPPLLVAFHEPKSNLSDVIHHLVENGADVNAQRKFGPGALHQVVKSPEIKSLNDMVHFLVSHGGDINLKGKNERSMLHNAAKYRSLQEYHSLLRFLVENSLQSVFETKCDRHRSPFHYAAYHLELDDATLAILTKYCDINAVSQGSSVLHSAIEGGRSVTTLETLIRHGADWKQTPDHHSSVLHPAAGHGHLAALKYFLDLGADVNARVRGMGKWTPLHSVFFWPSKANLLEVVQLLVESGGDINSKARFGYTPLQVAVTNCNSPLPVMIASMKYLIERGADVNSVDIYGNTFLHEAPRCRSKEEFHGIALLLQECSQGAAFQIGASYDQGLPLHYAVRYLELEESTLHLLMRHCDINATDNKGNSVFYYAIFGGRSRSFLEMLIKLGADWKRCCNKGQTVLHWAAKACEVSALKFFLELGSDPNSKDEEGVTPLHNVFMADSYKERVLEVVTMLAEGGAEIGMKNGRGQTAVDVARTGFYKEYWEGAAKYLESLSQKTVII